MTTLGLSRERCRGSFARMIDSCRMPLAHQTVVARFALTAATRVAFDVLSLGSQQSMGNRPQEVAAKAGDNW
jgi:hypothetical protein